MFESPRNTHAVDAADENTGPSELTIRILGQATGGSGSFPPKIPRQFCGVSSVACHEHSQKFCGTRPDDVVTESS